MKRHISKKRKDHITCGETTATAETITPSEIVCSFSSPLYTNDNTKKSVCKSSIDKTPFIMCSNCLRNNRPVYRCFNCYQKLAEELKNVAERNKSSELICNDATEYVRTIDWTRAKKESDIIIREQMVKKIDTNLFQWVDTCPCCGDKMLPPPPPLPIKVDKTQLDNQEIRTSQFVLDHDTIDPTTCESLPSQSLIELVYVPPLFESDMLDELKHRRFGPNDGWCRTFHSKPDPSSSVPQYRIIVTPSTRDESELVAVSTCCYAPQHRRKFNAEIMQEYVKAIQEAGRVETSSGKTQFRPLPKNISGGVRFAHLRSSRASGAGGINNSMQLGDIKAAQASPLIHGAQARRPEQTVQVALSRDGLITELPLIYWGPKSNSFTRNFKGNYPAMKGNFSYGHKVLTAILNMNDETKKRLLPLHEHFTVCRIDTAFIYRALETHPVIRELGYNTVSSCATNNIITSWQETKKFVVNRGLKDASSKSSDPSFNESLRSQPDYTDGEEIWYISPDDDDSIDDNWRMGVVLHKVENDESEERLYCIQRLDVANDDDDDEDDIILVYEDCMTGKIGSGKWMDELDVDRTTDDKLQAIEKILDNYGDINLVLLWSTVGNYNTVLDSVGMHRDNFGSEHKGSVKETIENGIDVPFGECDPAMKLPPSGSIVEMSAVPGSLFIPALGVATIRDRGVELIDLHQHLHTVVCREEVNNQSCRQLVQSSTATNPAARIRDSISRSTVDRGAWCDGKFYPHGGSILDWTSRLIGSSITAVTLRARVGHTRQYRHERRQAIARRRQAIAQRRQASAGRSAPN